MTHDLKTELSDEQLMQAVGGGFPGGIYVASSDVNMSATIGVDSGSTLTLGHSSGYGGTTEVRPGLLVVK